MLMHHLLNENVGHSLEEIIQERYNDDYKKVFWSTYASFETAPEEAQKDYACRDVVYTGKLYLDMVQELAVSGVPNSLVDHVHKLAEALYDTEVQGVRVDIDYAIKLGTELEGKIHNARIEMRKVAPEVELVELDLWMDELEKRKTPKGRAGVQKPDFNWDSGKQLQALIYDKLGLPIITKYDKKTKTSKPTLNDEALTELEDYHSAISLLSEYRGNQKVFTSFIQGTLDLNRGGIIYPNFNVNGAKTGRISHSDPNLAQLPSEGGIRGIYIPSEGCKFISADYGMIEVVVAAHYSKDKALFKIIYDGASKHDITADSLKIERKLAKRINFAVGYGATEFKIAQILGCSINEAKNVLSMYWNTYAGEKSVIDQCKKKVDDGLPIIGLFGRKRRFPSKFNSKNEQNKVYRQAYNALIQGSASDITHEAYYTINQYLREKNIGRAVVEVHDQVLAEAKENVAKEALDSVVEIMNVGKKYLSVPLTADPQGPMSRWED
jgi:DNA polymerase-1